MARTYPSLTQINLTHQNSIRCETVVIAITECLNSEGAMGTWAHPTCFYLKRRAIGVSEPSIQKHRRNKTAEDRLAKQ